MTPIRTSRAHRIAFRKAAVLDHRDTAKRERRSIVAQRHTVQGAERITRFECMRRGRNQGLHRNPANLVTRTVRLRSGSRCRTPERRRSGTNTRARSHELSLFRRIRRAATVGLRGPRSAVARSAMKSSRECPELARSGTRKLLQLESTFGASADWGRADCRLRSARDFPLSPAIDRKCAPNAHSTCSYHLAI